MPTLAQIMTKSSFLLLFAFYCPLIDAQASFFTPYTKRLTHLHTYQELTALCPQTQSLCNFFASIGQCSGYNSDKMYDFLWSQCACPCSHTVRTFQTLFSPLSREHLNAKCVICIKTASELASTLVCNSVARISKCRASVCQCVGYCRGMR